MVAGASFNRLNRPTSLRKGGKAAYYAHGRKKDRGAMNRTEARYEAEVLKPALLIGEIGWYAYDAINLRLADRCFFKVDFAVLADDGVLEMVDVKGAKILVEDDARVKIKVAAETFPFRFLMAWPVKGGGWHREVIGNA